MPQTPMTAAPATPLPQTPGAAAAQGWMDDIKKVISFDSVEEFWGYVVPLLTVIKLELKRKLFLSSFFLSKFIQ